MAISMRDGASIERTRILTVSCQRAMLGDRNTIAALSIPLELEFKPVSESYRDAMLVC